MLDACTSGGVSGGSDTQGVFQLAHRYAVLLRDIRERLAREEETDDILDLGAAAFECRLPKARRGSATTSATPKPGSGMTCAYPSVANSTRCKYWFTTSLNTR